MIKRKKKQLSLFFRNVYDVLGGKGEKGTDRFK